MNFDLLIQGFSIDEEMREELMLRCRRIVLGVGSGVPVRATIRQVEGRVQGRIEVRLPGRRVSAVVWRTDPMDAMEGAVDAVMDAVGRGEDLEGFGVWGQAATALSTHQ